MNQNTKRILITAVTASIIASITTYIAINTTSSTSKEHSEDQDNNEASPQINVTHSSVGLDSSNSAVFVDDALSLDSTTPSPLPPGIPTNISTSPPPYKPRVMDSGSITVAYTTTTRTCEGLANSLVSRCNEMEGLGDGEGPIRVVKLEDIDWWDEVRVLA